MVLVVCTGNICRSPMAEAWLYSKWGGTVAVESAGVGALIGHSAAPFAIDIASKHGLDITKHVARQISVEMIRRSDLILVMENLHKDYILRLAPWATGKVWLFGFKSSEEVDDPFGKMIHDFETTFQQIEKLGSAWLNFPNSKAAINS